MKLSVSIPDDDVLFIDRYAAEHAVRSRSGVVKRALSLLRANELGEAYAEAWADWAHSDQDVWDSTAGDGLSVAG